MASEQVSAIVGGTRERRESRRSLRRRLKRRAGLHRLELPHGENTGQTRPKRRMVCFLAGGRYLGSSQNEAALVTLNLGRKPGCPWSCANQNEDGACRDLLRRARDPVFQNE